MGSSVKVPEPSAEEKDLQKAQAEQLRVQTGILQGQQRQQTVLNKFVAEQEGYKVETDAAGNITSISKVPDELDGMRKEIETLYTEKTLKALKGELPVDPALEQSLATNQRDLQEKLSKQLGPGWETSSAGIETMGEFTRNSEILRMGARTQQLTLAEQLGLTRQQQDIFRKQTSMDNVLQQTQGVPMALAGAFGQNAVGYGKAQEPFIKQREMQLNAAIANQKNKTAMFGAGIGLVGALFSDKRLKEDLEQIGWHSELDVPIYSYRYLGEANRHIGVLAEDVARNRPDLVGERYGWQTVDYDGI